MGGQSLCPVSRGLLYSTFPAMQEAPTSGGEPRKMMWVFSKTLQVMFLLTVAFEVTASENSAWRKMEGACLACTFCWKWLRYWNPTLSSFHTQAVCNDSEKTITRAFGPAGSSLGWPCPHREVNRNKAPWRQRQLDSLRNIVFFGNGVPTLKRIVIALRPAAFMSALYFSHWKPPVSPS